jgi:hypothetical protein
MVPNPGAVQHHFRVCSHNRLGSVHLSAHGLPVRDYLSPLVFSGHHRLSHLITRSTFALVTGNDTDPNYVEKNKNVDGNDNQGKLSSTVHVLSPLTIACRHVVAC